MIELKTEGKPNTQSRAEKLKEIYELNEYMSLNYKTMVLSDISLTLAMILDEMRGIENEESN